MYIHQLSNSLIDDAITGDYITSIMDNPVNSYIDYGKDYIHSAY